MLSKTTFAITFRYTDETYRNIENFRDTNDIIVVNSPTPITCKIPRFIVTEEDKPPIRPNIYLFEMNNTQNKVINIIKMSLKQPMRKEYKIHDKKFYNRLSYFGKSIIERSSLEEPYHIFMMEYIDHILFKGKDHSKRASGFTLIPQKKIQHTREVILEFIQDVFKVSREHQNEQ